MVTTSGLSYRLLGPLEVWRDDVPVALGTPKQRSVLACLLLARGRIVTSDRLLSNVWGADLPTGATANLQVYVSRLRSALRDEGTGVSAIARRSPGYVLTAEPGAIDADVFTAQADALHAVLTEQRWSAALDLAQQARAFWRGPVLGDLGDASWFRAEADALEGRLVDVGTGLLTSLLALGRPQEAAATAKTLAADSPYRDELCRLEMVALQQSGRTVEALEVYTRHASRLDEELGIDPGEELRETQVAVLRQDPWLASWPLDRGQVAVRELEAPANAGPAAEAAPVTPAPAAEGSDLVGREGELRAATGLVDDVVAGTSRSLVLTGPAGIGKTRLAEEVLADLARRGGRCVRGRCLEEDGAPAWWPLRQVVRELGADPDTVLDAPDDAGADTRRFAVYELVRELLETAASEQPLAVLVDDLQWADPPSIGCLSYLASALGDAAVLLVSTVRDSETSAWGRKAASSVLRAPGARQLAVPPLARSDVSRLAGQISGERLTDAEARTLAEHTRGNALFVCEYARLPRDERLHGEVPMAVRGVLAQRVETLDVEVLRLLQVAAIMGDVLDLALLERASGTPRDELLDLLDLAADAAIIESRQGGAGYGFAHALLRDEVLSGLSPLRRQRLHARVAATLMTAGGDHVTQRAQHLASAGPLVDARDLLEACRAAALQAEERTSSETAVGWWEQALRALERLPDDEQDPQERDDLIVARVEALVRAGRGATVIEVVDGGLLEAARMGRTSTAGRLAATLLRASGTWPWVVFGEDPGPLIARLTGLLPFVEDDVAARVRVLAALGVGHCYDLDRSIPDHYSLAAVELAETTSDPELLADALVGRVITYVGESTHAEECERHLDRLVALPRSRQRSDAAFAHSARSMSQILLGDMAGMERQVRLGVAASDQARLPVIRAQLRWMEVGIAQWHRGPEAARLVLSAAVVAHQRTELYNAGFGDLVRLTLAFDEPGASLRDESFQGFEQDVWAAVVAADRGQRDEAASLITRRLDTPAPWIWATLAHMMVLAALVADLELVDLAPRMVEVLGPHAGRLASLGQGPIIGPVDYSLARLTALAGDVGVAREHLARARALCERNRGRLWVERCDRLAAALGDPVSVRP